MIADFPEQHFIGGGEESFGFMVGDFVRDKDAVTSTLLACEIGASAKANGSSFYKELIQCYVAYGHYMEKLISPTKKGMQGAQEIVAMMDSFKNNPVKTLDGSPVIRIDDYNESISLNPLDGSSTPIDLPKSNVLIYTSEDGTRMAARPSGTEPKIKFYFSVNRALDSAENFDESSAILEEKIDRIIKELKLS